MDLYGPACLSFHLQQLDAPQELYDDPQNEFVASFIGNPPINKLEGTMRGGDFVLDDGERINLNNPNAKEGQRIILGIRPDYDGLVIDPCLPDSMDGFTLSRLFRGTRYEVTVKRGERKGLTVDGAPVAGNTVPLTDAPVCRVELTV